MAKISLDRIIPLLLKQESQDGALGLLREIIVLQAKLDTIDKQDFYFQTGQFNHTDHLGTLMEQYAHIVETVNGNSVDYFLDIIKENEGKVQKLTCKGYLSTIDQIALGAIKSEISKHKNMIHIKGQFGELKPLYELLNDEEMLMTIFTL